MEIIKKNMKLLILTIATILSHGLFGQNENRFKNFHGIKDPQNNVDFFEAEGYDIFIQPFNNGLDEKGISKIKKKYSINHAQLTTDSLLNLSVLTTTKESNGITAYGTYYLIPETNKKTNVVGFVRLKTRDIALERDFVNSYLSNRIPSSIYTRLVIDSIDFVGRTIQLGPPCTWMSPHNIQCPNYGQMNWAIFDDLKSAEEYRDTRFEMAKSEKLGDLIEEKWLTLKFEGQDTKALRTKMKIQVSKLGIGGSNILIAYYVTGYIRGKYVTCVLSHYTGDAGVYKLPLLLRQVLELTE
jgi:hypothetical protein